MKLFELKKIHACIKQRLLENFSDPEKDLKLIAIELINNFQTSKEDVLPKVLEKAYNDYKQSMLRLNSIYTIINSELTEYEKMGLQDTEEVKDFNIPDYNEIFDNKNQDPMIEIVKSYELTIRHYTYFKLCYQQALRNKNFQDKIVFDTSSQRHINVLPHEFSNEFENHIRQYITKLLRIMSGKFDFDAINNQLHKELKLEPIQAETFLHENFGKDGSCAYFENQCTFTPQRDTNTPIQNQKVEDFVNTYLMTSKYPKIFTPNLKALLSTLINQGAIGYSINNTFGNFFSMNGVKIINFGQGYQLYIAFDNKNQLRIQILVGQHIYMTLTEQIEPVTSLIQIKFAIKLKNIHNTPLFDLGKISIACSFLTPSTHPMTISEDALKLSSRVPKDKLNALATCMKYIAKFLGYNSVENFYAYHSQKSGTQKHENEFQESNFEYFLQIASQSAYKKKLSEQEFEFFSTVVLEKYQQKSLNSRDISKLICKFVKFQLNNALKMCSADKVRYIYWIQLAKALLNTQDKVYKIYKLYELFVDKFSHTEPDFLIEAAKKDVALYITITTASNFFNKKIYLSDSFHAVMLANYPVLWIENDNDNFVNILTNLKAQAKLLFLVNFIKNKGKISYLEKYVKDFFNQDFITYLKKELNENKLKTFYVLATQTPSDSYENLRKLLVPVFENYHKKILSYSAPELLEFLYNIHDKNLFPRFGIDFLKKLAEKISQLADSEELKELSKVHELVGKIISMLNNNSVLLENSDYEDLLIDLSITNRKTSSRLSASMQERALIEKKENTYSTSDEENIAALLDDAENDDIDVHKNEQKLQSSVKSLKNTPQKKEKSVASPNSLFKPHSEKKEKTTISSTRAIDKLNSNYY